MATSSKQPFEVSDFSFGLTDDAFETDPRYSTELDNFIIEPDGSLQSRDGSLVEDTTNPQIPSGRKRIGKLINYDNDDTLLVVSEKNVYYRNPSAYATLVGPVTSNPVFNIGVEASNVNFSEWNKQVFITNDDYPTPSKIFKDTSGNLQVRTSGIPGLASSPTCTPTAGANAYIYAFHYSYTYTVGDQTFEDVGPVTTVSVSNADAPNSNQIAITNIPALANSTTYNWGTATMKVKIFRTQAGGTTLYYVGEVTNGTTSYNDTASDATISSNVLIYIADGTVDYDPVPLHKYCHIVNGIAYYGHIKESTVQYPFRIRQSIPFAPSGAPATFYVDVEDTVRGIGSVISLPIVLCNRNVYRIDGNFDQFGRGGMTPVRISDTAGCVSHNSIVTAEGKLFWAGTDGFYMTDGYKVMKISDKLNSRYKNLIAQTGDTERIEGKFDEENRRIIWTAQKNSSSDDVDSAIILDLKFDIRPNSTFTTWSGTSFLPTAIEFFNGKLYRGDNEGYTYYHESGTYTDPRVDVNTAAADWEEETIIWNYTSLNYNFGSNFFRKKPTRMLLIARNIANTSIQVTSIDDDGKRERTLKEIRWRRNFIWGDVNFIWGDPDCKWRNLGVIEQWRRFPAKGLRVTYCQIKISNAYSVTINSDILGQATFDNNTNTATLVNDWPTDCVDYFISTSADSYVTQFKVLSKTAKVLTLVDSANQLPTGSYPWLLKGYKKGEPLNLIGYTIHIADEDQMNLTYETGDDGANA